jgi:hypothetical protein
MERPLVYSILGKGVGVGERSRRMVEREWMRERRSAACEGDGEGGVNEALAGEVGWRGEGMEEGV